MYINTGNRLWKGTTKKQEERTNNTHSYPDHLYPYHTLFLTILPVSILTTLYPYHSHYTSTRPQLQKLQPPQIPSPNQPLHPPTPPKQPPLKTIIGDVSDRNLDPHLRARHNAHPRILPLQSILPAPKRKRSLSERL
jgi:hypothetical protein